MSLRYVVFMLVSNYYDLTNRILDIDFMVKMKGVT